MHRDQAAFGLELQGPGTDLNAVGIMNVYSFFVSLSPFSLLSSAIVFVIELYGRFCVCLIHVPTCIPTEIHTQIFFFRGGIKSFLPHTTLIGSRCREWAAFLELCWCSMSVNLCLWGGVKR